MQRRTLLSTTEEIYLSSQSIPAYVEAVRIYNSRNLYILLETEFLMLRDINLQQQKFIYPLRASVSGQDELDLQQQKFIYPLRAFLTLSTVLFDLQQQKFIYPLRDVFSMKSSSLSTTVEIYISSQSFAVQGLQSRSTTVEIYISSQSYHRDHDSDGDLQHQKFIYPLRARDVLFTVNISTTVEIYISSQRTMKYIVIDTNLQQQKFIYPLRV